MANVEELRRQIEELAAQQKAYSERAPQEREALEDEARSAMRETTERMNRTPGRIGLVSPERRASTRTSVEEMGWAGQAATEMAPGTFGAMLGGGVGSLLGPVGTVGGAALGGVAGELLGQEAGITPESDVSLGVAGGAPLLGPVVGGAGKLLRRGVGRGFGGLPFVKTARGELAKQEAEQVVLDMGADLFATRAAQTQAASGGRFTAGTADDLFDTLRRVDPAAEWNQVPSQMFRSTREAVDKLPGEFEHVKVLFSSGEIPKIDFPTIARLRGELKTLAVRGTEPQKKAARDVLNSIERDMDDIIDQVKPQKGMARQTKEAIKRQRLEFAVQDLDEAAMSLTKPVAGSEDAIELSVSEFRSWLFHRTNPRDKLYDPQLVEDLGQETIKALNKNLARLEDKIKMGKPGGPGSLVIQGRMAAGGAMAGGLLFGPTGAGVGAIAATTIPRMWTRALMSPKARRVMETMARIGHGNIPMQRWTTIMELTAQGLETSRRQQFEDTR